MALDLRLHRDDSVGAVLIAICRRAGKVVLLTSSVIDSLADRNNPLPGFHHKSFIPGGGSEMSQGFRIPVQIFFNVKISAVDDDRRTAPPESGFGRLYRLIPFSVPVRTN